MLFEFDFHVNFISIHDDTNKKKIPKKIVTIFKANTKQSIFKEINYSF